MLDATYSMIFDLVLVAIEKGLVDQPTPRPHTLDPVHDEVPVSVGDVAPMAVLSAVLYPTYMVVLDPTDTLLPEAIPTPPTEDPLNT